MTGRYYDERKHYLRKNAVDRKTRFWGSVDGQLQRFDAVLRNVESGNILDIGCGVGDLLFHMVHRGNPVRRYKGIDIVPEFVAEARSRNLPGEFAVGDIAAPEFDWQQVDWSVAIGLFGHAQDDGFWQERYETISGNMWCHSRQGIAISSRISQMIV